MVGRKLDQGILVQVVFEDTVIRAVHHVKVNRPAEHAMRERDDVGQEPGDAPVPKRPAD